MTSSIIKFIGTGSGKTSLKRFHSSFLIFTNRYNILVDAGDGISRALLSQDISFSTINGILITHLHPDHFSGLASLIVQMKLTGREKDLQIFIPEGLSNISEDFLYHSYIFKSNLGFNLFITPYIFNSVYELNSSFSFIGKPNSHLEKYRQYSDEREIHFLSGSILFKIEDKKIFYTGDIGRKDDLYLFEDHNIDIIVSEITHIDIEDLLEASKKLNIKKIYITHISDESEKFIFRNELISSKENLFPVVDGFTIHF